VDIGANNLLPCVGSSGIDPACVAAGQCPWAADLPQILIALRAAAGPGVPIVGMNYYDAFLAAWRLIPAPDGPALAVASLQVQRTLFNSTLEAVYNAFRVPVGSGRAAFHINDFSPVAAEPALNVELTLAWTWDGAPATTRPNIHPNAVGYAVISPDLRQGDRGSLTRGHASGCRGQRRAVGGG